MAEVLRVCPQGYLLIVGDGPLRAELQALSHRLGIERSVVFVGYREDVPAMLSIFDVAVIASINEGFGQLSLIEAMAMGKAIVGTNISGIKEIMQDRYTGLLVPAGDSTAMANRIILLLRNHEERLRLGARALEESRKYSLDSYTKALERIYQEVARALVE